MAGRQMIFVYERDQRQNICCFVLNVTMVSADLVFNFTLGIATVLIIIAQRSIIVFPSYRPNLFPTSRAKSNRWWSRTENKNILNSQTVISSSWISTKVVSQAPSCPKNSKDNRQMSIIDNESQ